MADQLLSTIAGGGGILKPVAFTSGRVSSGASGDILTVTAGTGQYLKLTWLTAAATEAGMTLTIDGVDLFTNVALDDSTPLSTSATSTGFAVMAYYTAVPTAVDMNASARLLKSIYCTSFTVTKVSGATSSNTEYAYETMEAI